MADDTDLQAVEGLYGVYAPKNYKTRFPNGYLGTLANLPSNVKYRGPYDPRMVFDLPDLTAPYYGLDPNLFPQETSGSPPDPGVDNPAQGPSTPPPQSPPPAPAAAPQSMFGPSQNIDQTLMAFLGKYGITPGGSDVPLNKNIFEMAGTSFNPAKATQKGIFA